MEEELLPLLTPFFLQPILGILSKNSERIGHYGTKYRINDAEYL